jgi:hypothetical protein
MRKASKTARAATFSLMMLCGSTGVVAQSAPGPISDSHRAAVVELMDLIGIEGSIKSSMGMMMDVMMQSNPQMEALRPVMESFFGKYFTWEELQDDFVVLYATNFNEAEVGDLLAFYRTPTGRKAAVTVPALMEQGGLIGQRQVEEHLPELEQMIQDFIARSSLPQVN